MSEDLQVDRDISRLPKEFVDELTNPFALFLHTHAASGAVLLVFTIAAIALSNSPWAHLFLGAWEIPLGNLQLLPLAPATRLSRAAVATWSISSRNTARWRSP